MKLIDIFEDRNPQSRRDPASFEKLDALMPRFTSAIQKWSEGARIYRGVSQADNKIYLVNPSKHVRKSRNTINFYTMFLDNDPQWSMYPKRSQALVCSSSPNYAEGFGLLFAVLLENGAHIGVCSRQDFWISFPVIRQTFSDTGYPDMNDLNRAVAWLCETFLGEKLNTDNVQIMMDQLDRITKSVREKTPDELKLLDLMWSPIGKKLIEMMKKESLTATLRNLYNPKKNDFELQTIENFDAPVEREVWSSDLAFMVPLEMMPQVVERYNKYKAVNKI